MSDREIEPGPADTAEDAAPAPAKEWARALLGETASVATVALAALRVAWRSRRWRAAQMALGALLLLTSVVTSGDTGRWNTARLAEGRAAPFTASSMTAGDARPDTSFTLSRGVVMPTPTATPNVVGDGTPGVGGSWPTYTGPVAAAQGCPGGQASKPVSWAVWSASGYGAPRRNTVALTFDDGPTPYSSPAILSFLERTHTPATFFVLGQYAKAYPWLIQREAADGFTIGIHTWSHPDMRLLTPAQRAWQFAATVQQLHTDLGPGVCLWLWRPPYDSYNTSIMRQAGTYGLTTITWNVDPADWSRPGTMTIVNRVLAQARPGSIILMHDGPAAREQTAAALPYILAGLRARGLTPVSLPQLLQGYQPTAPSPTATPGPTDTPTPTATSSPTATTMASAAASDSGAPFVAGWMDTPLLSDVRRAQGGG